jgi:hypothetical protein
VIDVLAGTLDLPEQDRAMLRTWYERHRSFFRVLARHEDGGEVKTITARNVVNGETYTIRMNAPDCPFERSPSDPSSLPQVPRIGKCPPRLPLGARNKSEAASLSASDGFSDRMPGARRMKSVMAFHVQHFRLTSP